MSRCLIVNSKAGAVRQFEDQIERLAVKHSCELIRTHEVGGIQAACEQALAKDCQRLVVAGGDGTIHRVVNALAPDFGVELAILPFGTGNDLARSLDIQIEQLHSAMHTAFSHRVQPIDLIKIETSDQQTTYCINIANGGFGGRVAIDVEASDKKRWGRMAYWVTSVSQLVNLQQFRVRLEMEDQVVETPTYGVAVANGRFVGGGFPIAPYALLDNGFMDVTAIPVLPAMELMAAGMNFLWTRDHRNDGVRTYRVKRLHFTSQPDMPFSVDGEPIRSFDATFEVVPSVLRVVTGVAPPGLIDNEGEDGSDLDQVPRLFA